MLSLSLSDTLIEWVDRNKGDKSRSAFFNELAKLGKERIQGSLLMREGNRPVVSGTTKV